MAETLNQYKSNLTPEEVDQALHNIAQLDDGIAQAKQYAEQAQGYAESINPGNFYTKTQADSAFAPKSHASTLATYGTGSSAVYGHVKLSDTPGASDTSGGTAATPKCVQDAVNSGAEVETLSVTSLASEVTVNSPTKCFKCANLLVLFLSFTVSSSLTNWQAIAKISGVSGAIPNYGKVATIATGVVPAEDIRITADGTVEAYIFGSSYTHSYTGILITFCQD